jgi:hypothetical protein
MHAKGGASVGLDHLWRLLDSVQGQIRAFDIKAQVAVGINGVLIGFLISQLMKDAELGGHDFHMRFLAALVLTGASILASVAAVLFGVRVIHPQLHLRQPSSMIFFCHIANECGTDFARGGRMISTLSDEDMNLDIANQVAVNSYICDVKAKRCKFALLATAGAFLLYALSVIPSASMVYSAARAQQLPSQVQTLLTAPVASAIQIQPATRAWSDRYAVPLGTVIGAVIALLGVGVTLWGSRTNAKEQNGLASRMKLADFRESWLNNLRNTIAELTGVLLATPNLSDAETLRTAAELATRAKLLLNKKDERYHEFITLLDSIINDDNRESRFKFATELTAVVQDILKAEWNVLKRDLEYQPPRVRR